MAEVVINTCYGGFGLSRAAVARIAELQGRPCYFFKSNFGAEAGWTPITLTEKVFIWSAFDIPNPNEVLGKGNVEAWHSMTMEEKQAHNALYASHCLESRFSDRSNPLLVQVVKELGEKANGEHAQLTIVEVPDDVEWEISEYDGNEHVAEKHRTWS